MNDSSALEASELLLRLYHRRRSMGAHISLEERDQHILCQETPPSVSELMHYFGRSDKEQFRAELVEAVASCIDQEWIELTVITSSSGYRAGLRLTCKGLDAAQHLNKKARY